MHEGVESGDIAGESSGLGIDRDPVGQVETMGDRRASGSLDLVGEGVEAGLVAALQVEGPTRSGESTGQWRRRCRSRHR